MSLLSPSGAEQVRKAAMRDDIALRGEYLFAPPAAVARLLTPLLTDQRDLPILYLYLNIALLVVPSAAAIHLLGCTSHLAGAAYFIGTYVLFLQRFMLALHYSEHRRLFRTGEQGRRPSTIIDTRNRKIIHMVPGKMVDELQASLCNRAADQHLTVWGYCHCRSGRPQLGGPTSLRPTVWSAKRHVPRAPLRNASRGQQQGRGGCVGDGAMAQGQSRPLLHVSCL